MTTYLINGTTPLPLNGSSGWGTIINNALLSVDGRFTFSAPNYSLASNVVGSSLTSLGTLTSLAVSGAATIGGALTVTGNLTVNGTTTTINSTTLSVDDIVILLGGDTAPVADDNKDRGVKFRWYSGSAKVGFFGFDDSTGRFTFIPDSTDTSDVFSGTLGDIDVNNIYINGVAATGSGAAVRAASPTFTGTPTLPTGTIATTQTAADSSTKVATTAFVTTADNLKANIASPTFTGVPLSTTAAVDTNTTQIATTAYVVGQGYAKLASPTLTSPVLISAEERWNVVAGAPSSTQNIDIKTSAAWCYTSNTTTGFTPNFRGDGSTTLASLVAVGDSITISISVTNGTTAYVSNAIQIDSVSVTPKWLGGSAPAAGNVSSTDVYSYTIIKLSATPTYLVFASQTRFA